jgi:hypothetical protein
LAIFLKIAEFKSPITCTIVQIELPLSTHLPLCRISSEQLRPRPLASLGRAEPLGCCTWREPPLSYSRADGSRQSMCACVCVCECVCVGVGEHRCIQSYNYSCKSLLMTSLGTKKSTSYTEKHTLLQCTSLRHTQKIPPKIEYEYMYVGNQTQIATHKITHNIGGRYMYMYYCHSETA